MQRFHLCKAMRVAMLSSGFAAIAELLVFTGELSACAIIAVSCMHVSNNFYVNRNWK